MYVSFHTKLRSVTSEYALCISWPLFGLELRMAEFFTGLKKKKLHKAEKVKFIC